MEYYYNIYLPLFFINPAFKKKKKKFILFLPLLCFHLSYFYLFFYFAPFKVQSCLRSFPQNQNYLKNNNNNFPVFQHSASANLVILCKNIC